MSATGLRCTSCSATYPLDARFVCDTCLAPLEPAYDLQVAARTLTKENLAQRPLNLWRYHELLPVAPLDEGLPVGYSPLIKAPRLARHLGLRELYLKVEAANPTHSFKDRVVAVASAKAKELGLKVLACASTGNLAGAVAAQAAALGLEACIFIPADLEREKIVAASVPGARVFAIRGSYDDVNRVCLELAGELEDWAFVNVNLRSYYAQGSKTLAFETGEQLGWQAPGQVVAPIASGALYCKLHAGFTQAAAIGLLEGEPVRIFGAQASGCSPVATAFERGAEHIEPVRPDTIAKSLAIGAPADGNNALAVARATGGAIVGVEDEEIVEAIGLLARQTGLFTETAGGVTIATLARLAQSGQLDPDATTVAYLTGDGLKTPDAAHRFVDPIEIDADADEVLERVEPTLVGA
jgi:threonine synthase